MRVQMATVVLAGLALLSACATGGPPRSTSTAEAEQEVRRTEVAFAKSMADRDFSAFVSYLSADAVFLTTNKTQRGAAQVAEAWKPRFNDPKAPFSWAPDHIEVLASGDLALSTGPVMVDDKIVGRFNSIWRLEAAHTWRIVFDKGELVCACDTR